MDCYGPLVPASTKHRAFAALIAVGVLGLGIASGLVATRLTSSRPHPIAHRPPLTPSAPASAQPLGAPASGQWWKPLPTATGPFQPAQLVIEKLRVQATVEVKGLDANNVMEAPDRPTDVAWYTFTARPGSGGNAVFSGQCDTGQPGNKGVFGYLDQLVSGDLIEVVSDKRTEIRYRVSQTSDYSLSNIPMQQLLAGAPADEITLITCSGSYVRGGYDHRLVVRAVRVA